MRRWRKLINAFDSTINILAIVGAIVILFIMLSISTEVSMRYFLNLAPTWVIEISEYCLVFMTFLAAAWILREEGHVRIDIVLNRLSHRAQAILNSITSILGAIIWFIITWYGAQVTWTYFLNDVRTPSFLEMPFAPLLIVIPITSFVLSIQFLRRAYGYLKSRRLSPAQK